jgi:hypothetical protein
MDLAPWAGKRRLPPDILTPAFPIALPRGRMDVRLRVASYPNGSRALELQDADGRPFYWPTMAYCQTTAAGMLAPEDLDALVVAVKPSAMKNGMAGALMDAGLLVDLGIEMPSDRHFVRLMRLDLAGVMAAAEREAARALEPLPHALAAPPVPVAWQPIARRVARAFARQGKAVSEADAMLAWALASRALPAVPPPLPPSGEEIHERLAGLFRPYQA